MGDSNQAPQAPTGDQHALLQLLVEHLPRTEGSLPVCVAQVDLDFECQFVNGAYPRWFGLEEEDVPGRHIREIIGEATFERTRAALVAALGGEVSTLEDRIELPTIGMAWVSMRFVPLRRAAGVHGVLAIFSDDSCRKRAEAALGASERRFEAFFDHAPVAMNILDDRLRFLKLNPVVAAMNQPPLEDYIGKSLFEIIPDVAPLIAPMLERILATGEPRADHQVSAADAFQPGRQRHWVSSSFRIPLDGDRWGLGAITVEITDQKRAEAALNKSAEKLRLLEENLDDVLWMSDADNRVVYVSIGYERLFGRSRASLYDSPHTWTDAILPEDRDAVFVALEKPRNEFECRIRRPDGSIRWIRSRSSPVLDDSGSVSGRLGTAVDVTVSRNLREKLESLNETLEAKVRQRTAAAEQRAREAERVGAELQALLDTAPDAIVVIDARGIIERFNRSAEALFGYRADEAKGLSVGVLMPEPDRSAHPSYVARYLETRTPRVIGIGRNVMGLRKDGSEFPLRLSVGEMRLPNATKFVGILADRTRAAEAEATLRYQASLVACMKDAVVSTDEQQRVRSWNQAATRIYGWSADEAIGENLLELTRVRADDDVLQVMGGALRESGRWQGEVVHEHKDGTTLQISSSVTRVVGAAGTPEGLLNVNSDVTRFKQLEAESRQAQKMEAVGTLASGIAHDFNNILTGIIGAAERSLGELKADNPARRYSADVRDAALRGAAVVKQLMVFSRQEASEMSVAELDSVLAGIHSMLRSLIGEDVEFQMSLAGGGACVRCDSGQLEQVLMNLVVNARHAMPRGGSIFLSSFTFDVGEDGIPGHGKAEVGPYVGFSVRDTGVGMEEATRNRVFEPFFTTKGQSDGTGLGLSTAFAIVTQHQGYIVLESEPGEGSTFSVVLPRVTGEPAQERLPRRPVGRGRGQTILVIEDEPLVAMTADYYLSQGGYQVLSADSGTQAVEVARGHDGSIDLVLSDMVLPGGLSGPDAAKAVAEIEAGVPVVYMSAHPTEWLLRHGKLSPGTAALQKPFSAQELIERVRDAISKASARRPAAGLDTAGRTILLVEDDEAARDATRELFEELGYRVLAAERAATAVQLAGLHEGSIDILLTDLGLPDVGGEELARRLRVHDPRLPVVFVTGRATQDAAPQMTVDDLTCSIEKPVAFQTLADTVCRLLRTRSAP